MIHSRELRYWLALYRTDKIGAKRFAQLLSQEKCLSNYFNKDQPTASLIQWCQNLNFNFIPDWKSVDKDLQWAEQPGCDILYWHDPRYPALLKEIANPPPILFVKGNIDLLTQYQLAIVGSRNPSAQGRQDAFQFGYDLAQQGFIITSGLAVGIDTASHEGALAATCPTIAVLGSSLDIIYPPRNGKLSKRIIENGALVSEFPLNTPPKPQNFPRRNRIISGLSKGTLVIESSLKSGSLITAQLALEQGREIFAMPGSIHNPMSKGCHHLIRQGAKCVDMVEHILEEFPFHVELPKKLVNTVKSSLGDSLGAVLNIIETNATSVDFIVDKLRLTPQAVCSMLVELELLGEIISVPGGYSRMHKGN